MVEEDSEATGQLFSTDNVRVAFPAMPAGTANTQQVSIILQYIRLQLLVCFSNLFIFVLIVYFQYLDKINYYVINFINN